MKQARRFPVPASARNVILGAAATADQLDLAATFGSRWATGVLMKENQRVIGEVCGTDNRLPAGVIAAGCDDDLVVDGLTRDGTVWRGDDWEPVDEPVETVLLDAGEVAFVARALQEGCPRVLLRGYTPVAFIPETAAGTPPGSPAPAGSPAKPGEARQPDLPEGARVLAIVDDLDRNAVLDLVAVLPGPKVLRRHDGTWQEDPAWVNILRSVRPPPVVLLDEAQTASVLPQIDEATAGRPFSKEPPKKATAASGVDQRADEMALEYTIRAAADPARKAASKLTPGGTMPGQLQRYWVAGPGAAKIRWGTPGAMTRCARQLAKYVTPARAYATCNNISKKLGGKGIAWDVG